MEGHIFTFGSLLERDEVINWAESQKMMYKIGYHRLSSFLYKCKVCDGSKAVKSRFLKRKGIAYAQIITCCKGSKLHINLGGTHTAQGFICMFNPDLIVVAPILPNNDSIICEHHLIPDLKPLPPLPLYEINKIIVYPESIQESIFAANSTIHSQWLSQLQNMDFRENMKKPIFRYMHDIEILT